MGHFLSDTNPDTAASQFLDANPQSDRLTPRSKQRQNMPITDESGFRTCLYDPRALDEISVQVLDWAS